MLILVAGVGTAAAADGPSRPPGDLWERVEAADLVAEVTVLSSEEAPAPPDYPGHEAVEVKARLRLEEALLGAGRAGDELEVRYVRTLRVKGVESGLKPRYVPGRRLVALLRRRGGALELDHPFRPPPPREEAAATARAIGAVRVLRAAERVETGAVEGSAPGAAYAALLAVDGRVRLRALETLATEPGAAARAWAARGLGEAADPAAIPALYQLRLDGAEVPVVRPGQAAPSATSVGAIAASSLERYPGFARRVGALISRLERPEPLGGAAIARALSEMTGGDAGADARRWREWWSGSPPKTSTGYRGLPDVHRAVREADLVALGEAAAVEVKSIPPSNPGVEQVSIAVSFLPVKVLRGEAGREVRLGFRWDVAIHGAKNDVPPPIIGWEGLKGNLPAPPPRAVLLLRRTPDGSYRFLSDPEVPGGPFASMGWAAPDALAALERVVAEEAALAALEAAEAVEPRPIDPETSLGSSFALLEGAEGGGRGGQPTHRRALFEHLARSANGAARAWAVRGAGGEDDSALAPLLAILSRDPTPVRALLPGGRHEETTVGALAAEAFGRHRGRFHTIGRLIGLLRAPQGLDPARVAGALRWLTGTDLGSDPAAWERWWEGGE